MPPMDEWLTFINTAVFDQQWAALGLGDEELSRLQQVLIEDPEAGDVVGGTGGLRKVRFAPPGSGKSGGVRVGYGYFPGRGIVLLALAYGKRAKADLTPAEKKLVARMLKAFAARLRYPDQPPTAEG